MTSTPDGVCPTPCSDPHAGGEQAFSLTTFNSNNNQQPSRCDNYGADGSALLVSSAIPAANATITQNRLNISNSNSKSISHQQQPPALHSHMVSDFGAGAATKAAHTGRKRRVRNPEQWQRSRRRTLHVAGRQYRGTHGRLVRPKSIGPDCRCRAQCYTKIDEASRQKIFSDFYSLTSHDEQNAYLYGLIVKKNLALKRKLPPTSPSTSPEERGVASERRSCHYTYYVRERGQLIQMCKTAFANIHGISFKKIRILCEKLQSDVMFPRDGRGKHSNRPTRVSQKSKQQVRDHITALLSENVCSQFIRHPPPPSSSSLAPPGGNLANPDCLSTATSTASAGATTSLALNVAKMYQHFVKWCQNSAAAQQQQQQQRQTDDELSLSIPVKYWVYSRIFNDEFRATAERRLSSITQCNTSDPGGSLVNYTRQNVNNSNSGNGGCSPHKKRVVTNSNSVTCTRSSCLPSSYICPSTVSCLPSTMPPAASAVCATSAISPDRSLGELHRTLTLAPPERLSGELIRASVPVNSTVAPPERLSGELIRASVPVNSTVVPPSGELMNLSQQLPQLLQLDHTTTVAATNTASASGDRQQLQLFCVPMLDYLELQAQPLDLHQQQQQHGAFDSLH